MLLGRWILPDAQFSALEPVRRRRVRLTADQQRALSEARRRASAVLAVGVLLIVAGIVVVLTHHPLTGIVPLALGLVVARAGERGFARIQGATDRLRPVTSERGPEPNHDAIAGAGSHGHF